VVFNHATGLRLLVGQGVCTLIIDYINEFPIDSELLPPRLRSLLEPVGMNADVRVEVSTRFEKDPYGPDREHIHMVMAVMDEGEARKMGQPRAASDGVVAFSTPWIQQKGELKDYKPSIDDSDYIVASWGSGSFYTYMLAEKVWMALGLTMRVIGQEAQRVVFDDPSLPEFGIAEGEVSGSFHYVASSNQHWTMSNEYLRQYLWMRGAWGVRVFYYQTLFADTPELRRIMKGERHVEIGGSETWYLLDIREHDGGLLVQLWSKVIAVTPDRCPIPTADGLEWPGIADPMTYKRAEGIFDRHTVYLDDRFLEKYEQNSFYDSAPIKYGDRWLCSPSYQGQWGFSDCQRVGRNLIKTSIRELYKPKPDREIVHAFRHAVPPDQIAAFDLNEEHIVGKVSRLVDQLLVLGDQLSTLGDALGTPSDAVDIVKLSREEIRANGWMHYPELQRLAQVAALSMSEQAFLARCKGIHELYQRIPNGFIRGLVQKAGHARKDIGEIKSLKLLQALTNILQRLNADGERLDAFASGPDAADLTERNAKIGPLFINADLRNADAHQAGGVIEALTKAGYDVAGLNSGYGLALDHVFDKVIGAFAHLNDQLRSFLDR